MAVWKESGKYICSKCQDIAEEAKKMVDMAVGFPSPEYISEPSKLPAHIKNCEGCGEPLVLENSQGQVVLRPDPDQDLNSDQLNKIKWIIQEEQVLAGYQKRREEIIRDIDTKKKEIVALEKELQSNGVEGQKSLNRIVGAQRELKKSIAESVKAQVEETAAAQPAVKKAGVEDDDRYSSRD